MGQFEASLRLPGDSRALPATIQVERGRLVVASGEHMIGDWSLETIEINQVPDGFRVAAEGEVLLLAVPDRDLFAQETAPKQRPKRTARTIKTKENRGPSKLDGFLATARQRYGAKLPSWIFSRAGIVVAVALLALIVIFAELVSYVLLITGVVILVIGGVTMLDNLIAQRLLHHKVTPVQMVIGGGTVFVAGLLIGFAA